MSQQEEDVVSRVLDADVLKEIHEYGISIDEDVLYLEAFPGDEEEVKDVTWGMARRFQKNLRALISEGAEKVIVDINCPGGDEYQGMAIYDAIVNCPVHVTGIVSGEASSMASVILQACDERIVMPHAMVMYHCGHTSLYAPTNEIRSAAKFEFALGDKIDKIMFERIRKKKPDLTMEQFEVMVMKGMYYFADEAVEWGLADKVMQPPKKKSPKPKA